MASKLAVAGVIEGNLTDEGLAAMSECQDLTTLLAQELTLGLKNETDGLDIGDDIVINERREIVQVKPRFQKLGVRNQHMHAVFDLLFNPFLPFCRRYGGAQDAGGNAMFPEQLFQPFLRINAHPAITISAISCSHCGSPPGGRGESTRKPQE